MYNAVQVFRTLFKQEMIVYGYDSYRQKFTHGGKEKIIFLMSSKNNFKYLSFCKDARSINTIYNTLFYRKVDVVSNYFQSYGLIKDYQDIPSIYKHKSFHRVNQKWANKAKEVKEFVENLNTGNSRIGNNKYELDKYFNTTANEMTPEQKKMAKYIKEIAGLEKKNDAILRYIELPYREDVLADELVNILKKVMVF
jgi:hypothetical protein